MNIKEKTVLIVKKGNEFLVGKVCFSNELRWSISPWDAWMTRKRKEAEAVAGKVGGKLMLFNPVAKQIREARFQ